MLKNIQKAIFEIRSLIQSIPEVRKLVYYDTKNALGEKVPSIADTQEHFTVSAVFDITEPPFDKNTIVSIAYKKGNYDDEKVMMTGMININVLTKSQLWEINENKIRPLEIVNYIVDKLSNIKLSTSHKLFLVGIDLALLSENTNGYTVAFILEEGGGLDEQF